MLNSLTEELNFGGDNDGKPETSKYEIKFPSGEAKTKCLGLRPTAWMGLGGSLKGSSPFFPLYLLTIPVLSTPEKPGRP